jgi:hypothetical protein
MQRSNRFEQLRAVTRVEADSRRSHTAPRGRIARPAVERDGGLLAHGGLMAFARASGRCPGARSASARIAQREVGPQLRRARSKPTRSASRSTTGAGSAPRPARRFSTSGRDRASALRWMRHDAARRRRATSRGRLRDRGEFRIEPAASAARAIARVQVASSTRAASAQMGRAGHRSPHVSSFQRCATQWRESHRTASEKP